MNNEKGQALPLAIVALAIGALVVVPFLNHAGTTLLDSRLYTDGINNRDAADAGVEHAIWNLTEGGLAALIPNVGNQQTYSLPEAINGITPSMTVKTLTRSGTGGAAGKINKTILDKMIFNATAGNTPDAIKVSDTLCAVAFRGPSNRGYMVTMAVSSNGTIGNSVVSTLIFDNSSGYEPYIFLVTGNIYGVAYRGSGNSGYLKTMSIAANGVISAVISTLTFDATGYTPSVCKIASTVFAVAYRGAANRGYIKTVTISSGGVISGTVISTLTLDNTAGYEPCMIPVTGVYYAAAYRGASNRGTLKTVSITAAGVISGTIVSTLVFDTAASYEPVITAAATNIYAIAYRSAASGSLKTVSISTSGIIGTTVISTISFDTAVSYLPDILLVAPNTLAIVYGNSTNKGYLKTVTIASGGTITPTAIDTFNFDAVAGYEPSIIQISNTVFGVAYRATGTDGTFVTIGISNGSNPDSSYEIISTASNTVIRALVSTQNTTSTIVSWFPNE
jgi:hypothetical protein